MAASVSLVTEIIVACFRNDVTFEDWNDRFHVFVRFRNSKHPKCFRISIAKLSTLTTMEQLSATTVSNFPWGSNLKS